jgi:zinc protease
VFPNGLRLLVKENHATGLAAVHVWTRAGGFSESDKTAGTAHVIEHLLFRAGDRTAASIDNEIENLGGLLEARTEKDWTQIGCTVAGRHAGKVISLLGATLSKPVFREEDLVAERPVLLEELNQSVLNPTEVLTRELFRLAFKQHPYRFEVRGTGAFLSGVGIEAVRAYYLKHFVPAAMTVVVVGDVDAAGVERAVRAAYPIDGKPATVAVPPVEQPAAAPQRATLPGLSPAGFIALGYPSPAVSEQPDVHATDLLLTMLENGDGGRLPRLFRGAAGVNANFQTRRQAGLLTVVAQTLPDRVEQVETLLRRELEFVANGRLPVEELDLAKRALRGSYALDSETYSGQASTLGFYAAIDRWQFASEYLQKVEAVTIEQVRTVAAKSLVADRCIAVQMLPRDRGPKRPQQDGT